MGREAAPGAPGRTQGDRAQIAQIQGEGDTGHDRAYTVCSGHGEMHTWIIVLAPAPASYVAWAMPPRGCLHPFPTPPWDGAPGEGISDGGDHVRDAVTGKGAVFHAGLAGDCFRTAFSHPV